jgi:hypothetical protein
MPIIILFDDVGCHGRNSDSGVFTNKWAVEESRNKNLISSSAGSFKREIKNCTILFFIGDDAFPLSENLMKVYPGQHPKDS